MSHSRTLRDYRLGDIDDFYNDGLPDTPYVDPQWLEMLTNASNKPLIGFDDLRPDSLIPFTFKFNLQPDEVLVRAQLALALRASGVQSDSTRVYLGDLGQSYTYADLGWDPISDSETSVRVLDLGQHLDRLQEGTFNIALEGDSAVDWGWLRIRVASPSRSAK